MQVENIFGSVEIKNKKTNEEQKLPHCYDPKDLGDQILKMQNAFM